MADAATASTPKNAATKITRSDGGSEINDDTSASRTLPTATSTGYVRQATNSERYATHVMRTKGTISSQVGPSQIKMIGRAMIATNNRNGQCTAVSSAIDSR